MGYGSISSPEPNSNSHSKRGNNATLGGPIVVCSVAGLAFFLLTHHLDAKKEKAAPSASEVLLQKARGMEAPLQTPLEKAVKAAGYKATDSHSVDYEALKKSTQAQIMAAYKAKLTPQEYSTLFTDVQTWDDYKTIFGAAWLADLFHFAEAGANAHAAQIKMAEVRAARIRAARQAAIERERMRQMQIQIEIERAREQERSRYGSSGSYGLE